MSPARAFGWYVWTRHRRGLTILGGCWLALIVLCRSLAATDLEYYCGLLLYMSGVGFAYLSGIFTFSPDARLEARESGFPARLWHLPLRTTSLVGWPMLWGTGAVALAWLSLAWGLWPVFSNWPRDVWFGWLALILALVLAWMQVLVWSPLPLPWLRAVLIGPLLSSIVVVPLLLEERVVSPAVWRGTLVALLPAAYLAAVFGVSRARRGAVPRWVRKARPRQISATIVGRSFASPARAQLWFEWRRCGLRFPLVLGAAALAWLEMMPLTTAILDEVAHSPLFSIVLPQHLLLKIGSLGLAMVGFLLLPLVLAAACGPEMGNLSGRKRTRTLSSFLATRPVPVAMLVRVKFETAALSTLAGWGILAVVFSLWFALSGHAVEMTRQFEAMRQWHSSGSFWGCLVLLLVVAVGLTWLQMVKKIWEGLVIRGWGTVSGLLGFAGFILLVHLSTEWLTKEEERQTLANFLSWLVGATVALKCLAAAWSLRTLKRHELIPSGVLWGGPAVWFTLAVGLFAALYALLPDAWFSVSGVLFGIVLLLPLTRLALAPLALAWNRHR